MPLPQLLQRAKTFITQKVSSAATQLQTRLRRFRNEHSLSYGLEHLSDVTSQLIITITKLMLAVATFALTLLSYAVAINMFVASIDGILALAAGLGLAPLSLSIPGLGLLGLTIQCAKYLSLGSLSLCGTFLGCKLTVKRLEAVGDAVSLLDLYADAAYRAGTRTLGELSAKLKNYLFPNQAQAHNPNNAPPVEPAGMPANTIFYLHQAYRARNERFLARYEATEQANAQQAQRPVQAPVQQAAPVSASIQAEEAADNDRVNRPAPRP